LFVSIRISLGSNFIVETPAKRALFDILTDIVIQDKLGAGNFSEVFLGTWQGTPVALKSVSNVMELLKEIDVLKSINHPNIVSVETFFH
jgi:hypothetical protein